MGLRRGRRAPDRHRPARRVERPRGRIRCAPRGGVRGRARDHRPHQGRGADLEEGSRGNRGALGRRKAPTADSRLRTALRALPSVERCFGPSRCAQRPCAARGRWRVAAPRVSPSARRAAAPASPPEPAVRDAGRRGRAEGMRRAVRACGRDQRDRNRSSTRTSGARRLHPRPSRRSPPRPAATRTWSTTWSRASAGQRQAHVEELLLRADGRRGGDRREQQRGRGAACRRRARRRPRGGHLARAAGGDRRFVPDPRDRGAVGSAAGRGRHHEPDPPARLRACDRAGHGAH